MGRIDASGYPLPEDEIQKLKEKFASAYMEGTAGRIYHIPQVEYIPQPRDPLVTGVLTGDYRIHPNIWAAYQNGLAASDVTILLTRLVALGGIDTEGKLIPGIPAKKEGFVFDIVKTDVVDKCGDVVVNFPKFSDSYAKEIVSKELELPEDSLGKITLEAKKMYYDAVCPAWQRPIVADPSIDVMSCGHFYAGPIYDPAIMCGSVQAGSIYSPPASVAPGGGPLPNIVVCGSIWMGPIYSPAGANTYVSNSGVGSPHSFRHAQLPAELQSDDDNKKKEEPRLPRGGWF